MTLALEPTVLLLDEPIAGLGRGTYCGCRPLSRSADGRAQSVGRRARLCDESPSWRAAPSLMAEAATRKCRAMRESSPPTWANGARARHDDARNPENLQAWYARRIARPPRRELPCRTGRTRHPSRPQAAPAEQRLHARRDGRVDRRTGSIHLAGTETIGCRPHPAVSASCPRNDVVSI